MEQKFYICKHCGNIIAKVKDTGVPVICCGEPMSEIIPGTTDAAVEKHVPVWTVENGIVHVKVGSVEHPMLPEHYIEWVSLHTKQGNQRKELHPGEKPEVCFALCEGDEVEAAFKKWDINFVRVNAEGRFLSKLAGISDPERKRKIIGEEFIRVFEEESKKIGAVDFLAQGTIYPDVIESGLGNAAVIKSHHNVGGLPDYVDFKEIIEPLRLLFKDEVRQLGRELGLPEYLVSRQPFPGPGLAIRVIGEITKEKLDILREADFIFRDEIARAHLEGTMNQYFAVLTNMRSVGVMGDGRTYDYTLALRSVTTTDFMTADWTRIPYEVLDRVSVRIVNEVAHINRIVYDITSKPPATIEWE